MAVEIIEMMRIGLCVLSLGLGCAPKDYQTVVCKQNDLEILRVRAKSVEEMKNGHYRIRDLSDSYIITKGECEIL